MCYEYLKISKMTVCLTFVAILGRVKAIALKLNRKNRTKDFDRNFTNMKKVLYRHLFSKVLGLTLLLFSTSFMHRKKLRL